MSAVITARELTRSFGGKRAVDGVSFSVEKGEVFAFLGPNGAGKTTTVRMLTGVLSPTSGTATIMGYDIRSQPLQSRAAMAVVPEESNVYMDLSVQRNVLLMAELYGVPRRERLRRTTGLLERLGLADRAGQRAAALSKGLRQRLVLAAALVTGPEVLFLDEPTSGLDVHSARLIRDIVTDLKGQGITVFLTTHNMEEAGELSSRIAIIREGRLVATDAPDRLRSAIRSSQFVEVGLGGRVSGEELEGLDGVTGLERAGELWRLLTADPGATAASVLRHAESNGLRLNHICTRKPSLEEVFLHLTADGGGR